MKKYVLSVMIVISQASFAYDIPATSFKNQLGNDLQIFEMYGSNKDCNLEGVYPGMIWPQGQTILITGSCPNGASVKVEFLAMGREPRSIVGFAIDQNKASMWYNQV